MMKHIRNSKWHLLPLLLALLLLGGCAPTPGGSTDGTSPDNIVTITQANYQDEVAQFSGTVILDFYADWCGPCQLLAPILEEVARERPDIKIGKINVDSQAALSSGFSIEVIPTLVILRDGVVVKSVEGYRTKEEILSLL